MTLLLAVLFMALAVDTGRLWMQQRKLQSITDAAAMDAARKIGCSADMVEVRDAAQKSAIGNGYTGQLTQSPNVVMLGTVSEVNGIRQFSPDNTAREAVRVYATQSVPASLVAGGIFGNQVVLNAEAVSAANTSLVAFTIGTTLLSVDTQDSQVMNLLLGRLLGTSINIDAVSYEGLASANLTLADLIRAQGSVGNLEDLLEAEMSLGDLLSLVAEGLEAAGQAGGLELALKDLTNGIGNNGAIRLSDVIAMSAPNVDATAELSLNAFSIITAAALLANEGTPVSITVGGVTAVLSVTRAPLLSIGPGSGTNCTAARTAQLALSVTASAGLVEVGVNVEVAPGRAQVVSLSDDGEKSSVAIDATPGLATVAATLDLPLGISLEIPLNLTNASATQLYFEVDHPTDDNLPQTKTVSSSLTGSLENALQPLGISSVTSGLLQAIGAVLDPALELLGIRLGGMDVTLHDIQLRHPKPLII